MNDKLLIAERFKALSTELTALRSLLPALKDDLVEDEIETAEEMFCDAGISAYTVAAAIRERAAEDAFLPSDWKMWFKDAGMEHYTYDKSFTSFKGHGRHWRINNLKEFECSCPAEHFDRWANSRGAIWPRVPDTQSEFDLAVKTMIDESKDKNENI